jgi:hypothetical protein
LRGNPEGNLFLRGNPYSSWVKARFERHTVAIYERKSLAIFERQSLTIFERHSVAIFKRQYLHAGGGGESKILQLRNVIALLLL